MANSISSDESALERVKGIDPWYSAWKAPFQPPTLIDGQIFNGLIDLKSASPESAAETRQVVGFGAQLWSDMLEFQPTHSLPLDAIES